jgi:hypothetical protein
MSIEALPEKTAAKDTVIAVGNSLKLMVGTWRALMMIRNQAASPSLNVHLCVHACASATACMVANLEHWQSMDLRSRMQQVAAITSGLRFAKSTQSISKPAFVAFVGSTCTSQAAKTLAGPKTAPQIGDVLLTVNGNSLVGINFKALEALVESLAAVTIEVSA